MRGPWRRVDAFASPKTAAAHRAHRAAEPTSEGGATMGKRARKKKDRRKNNANHGKRPRC
ncbi:hypothetical protein GIY23_18620 [Allosaccharopolyspora coralli]|uniref:Uncharacterized protein n=1 Tax=Allosaccharopolyspora coralli TaxID=2665642 RepID=A0A5Q3Q9N0_9PSEU|nr:hypothetical protein [Allosaccharopolyspora coralli]QGK71268.1 hypothetical protein GIY23_18620 [Allosaccharopolyspora coralli]